VPKWVAGARMGPYTLKEPVGEGSAAAVWRAVYDGPGGVRKQVALKLIKGPARSETLEAVRREAKITARLQHPNIVDVLGVEIHAGALMVSMEYIGGGTLRELLQRARGANVALPVAAILRLTIDVLRALEKAHGREASKRPAVFHRDLKPENILLDAGGRGKVVDFGLAKLHGETALTAPGKIKGTHRYIPPEIWKGSRDFHPGCDLFALGCIVYEMATGSKLFGGGTGEIIDAIVNRTAADEARLVAERTPALGPIVEGLLRRDPADRYARAGDVLAHLVPLAVTRGGDIGLFLRLLRAREKGLPVGKGLAGALRNLDDPRWTVLLPAGTA